MRETMSRDAGLVLFEAMEDRVLFATTAVTPPPPPKPGVTLVKGVLLITANPTRANIIAVSLSKDDKTIDVSFDGKSSTYKALDVKDVKVSATNKGDKVSVNLAGLAPKTAPKNPPPPPPAGVHLKNGLITIAGDPTKANTESIALSKDAKNIDVTLDGKTSIFAVKLVADITVFDGHKSDALTVALGGLKLHHPVLVHGGFGNDTITGGGVNYDLPLAPPPPPPPTMA